MSGHCCFLCASDEGVFLDITKQNGDKFCSQLATCLSVQIPQDQVFENKVCYKCAFELGQCETFIKKYKKHCKKSNKIKTTCCALCFESIRKGYVFELNKDNTSLNSPLQRIHQLFNDNPEKFSADGTVICLACRYSLDILYDLKRVYEQTSTRLENQPKILTIAVSRKTTITEAQSVKESIFAHFDIDSSTMARGGSRVSKVRNSKASAKSKLRICDKCHNTVENGSDMFRFHRTGLTVCKTCWITMDPGQRTSRKRMRTESGDSSSVETKLCAVFLKDVLKDSALKDEKVYRTEKDLQGNTVYIITDESSESDSKSRKSSPESKEAKEDTNVKSTNVDQTSNVVKPTTVGKIGRPPKKRASTNAKKDSSDSDQLAIKKMKVDEGSSETSQESQTVTRVTRRKRKELDGTLPDSGKETSERTVKITRKKAKMMKDGLRASLRLSASSESSSQEDRVRRYQRRVKPSENVASKVPTAAVTPPASETIIILDDEKESATHAIATPIAVKSDSKVEKKSYSADETTQEFKSPVQRRRRGSSLSTITQKKLAPETGNVALPELKLAKVTPSSKPDDQEETNLADEKKDAQNENEAQAELEEVSITVDDEEDVPEADSAEKDTTEKDPTEKDTTAKDITEKDITEKDITEKDTTEKDSIEVDIEKNALEKTTTEQTAAEDTAEETADDTTEKDTSKEDASEKDMFETDASEKRASTEASSEKHEDDATVVEEGETADLDKTTAEKENLSEKMDVQELEDQNEEDVVLKATPDESEKEAAENNENAENNEMNENNENEEIKLTDTGADEEVTESSEVCSAKGTMEVHRDAELGADQSKRTQDIVELNNVRRSSTDSHKSTKDDDAKDNAEEETDIEQLKVSDSEANENQKESDDAPEIISNNIGEKQPRDVERKRSESPRKGNDKSPKVLRKNDKDKDTVDEKDVEVEADIKIVDTETADDNVEKDVVSVPETETVVLDDKGDNDDDDVVMAVDPSDEQSGSVEVTITREENGDIQSEANKENDKDFAEITIDEESTKQVGTPRKNAQEDSTTAATEVLQEVFQLATTESQKDGETIDLDSSKEDDGRKQAASGNVESPEIQTSADMPSLDPISAEIDNDEVLLD